MVKIVGIQFQNNGKIHYFDSCDLMLKPGDYVVADTAKGLDLGEVVIGIREAEESANAPMRKIVRIATPQDVQHSSENREKEREAYQTCKKKIAEHSAFLIGHFPRFFVKNRIPGNIGWQNVRRKLNSFIIKGNSFCKCSRKSGLSYSGNILHKNMTTCYSCTKHFFNYVLFSFNNAVYVLFNKRNFINIIHLLPHKSQNTEFTNINSIHILPNPTNLYYFVIPSFTASSATALATTLATSGLNASGII